LPRNPHENDEVAVSNPVYIPESIFHGGYAVYIMTTLPEVVHDKLGGAVVIDEVYFSQS
jgi:hypothetical protein